MVTGWVIKKYIKHKRNSNDIFSCDSSSICGNVCRSVGPSVGSQRVSRSELLDSSVLVYKFSSLAFSTVSTVTAVLIVSAVLVVSAVSLVSAV